MDARSLHAPQAAGAADGTPGLARGDLLLVLLQLAAVLALALQLAIDASSDNIVAAVLITLSSCATLQYLRASRSFVSFPLSGFALLGLAVTTQWGALLAQTAAWTPVADNLKDPQRTFALLALFQVVALLAHALHRQLRPTLQVRDGLSRLLRPLGIFDVPSPGNLWLLGVVGFLALFAGVGPEDGAADVSDKVIDGFRFLAWAPFLIPILRHRYGAAYCDLRRQGAALGAYTLAVVALGLALNVRSVMLAGVTTVALQGLLLLLMSRSAASARDLWRAAPFVVVGALAVAYTADLATAMVVARASRGEATGPQMIEATVAALFDPVAIDAYRENGLIAVKYGVYDEQYIANPVLARFVETKFHDNMFVLVRGLTAEEVELVRRDTWERVVSVLPTPLLVQLGLNGDKAVLSYSMGDYLNFLRYGQSLGSFRSGSVFANLIGVFGEEAAPLVFGVLALLLFICWDALARTDDDGTVAISPLAMLLGVSLFLHGLALDSLSHLTAMLIRGFAQSVLLYAAIYALTRLAFAPFAGAAARPPRGLQRETPA